MTPTLRLLASALLAAVLSPMTSAAGFLENRGQVDAQVRFYAQGSSTTVFFTDAALVMDVRQHTRGCAVWMSFAGANPAPRIEARAPLAARSNFFRGSDPAQWVTDVPSFGEIVYHDLWPGIDLLFRESDGRLSCEPVLAPGADPDSIRFEWAGAEGIADSKLSAPPFKPRASADNPAALAWSTFLGGSSDELPLDVAIDQAQNVLVTGLTISSRFPTTPGSYDGTYNGFGDVFVSKLAADGKTLLWSSYLGGSNASYFDYGYGLAVDDSGNAVVTGYTGSTDFPTTPGAFDRSHNGLTDAYVAKLSSDGKQLLWSTFLGSSDFDIAYSVTLDSLERPVVTGRTLSFDFPTTPGAYDRNAHGEEDVFVTKLDASGSSLVWSTLLGGSTFDVGQDIKLDAADNALVVGYTNSFDLSTTPGAYDESFNDGLYDAFVFKLSASGSVLLWCTYLGGEDYEYGNGIGIDASGNPVVAGETASTLFPTTPGAYDTSYNGNGDVFVAKLSGANSKLIWSTYLGGTGAAYETGLDLAVNATGGVVVTGSTPSPDFPVTPDAYDGHSSGQNDAFVSTLDASGSALISSTYLGGKLNEYGWAIALDRLQNPVIAGASESNNFPTTSAAYDRFYNGGETDVFVSKLRRTPVRQ